MALLVIKCNGDPMFARICIMQALGAGKTTGSERHRKVAKRYRVL